MTGVEFKILGPLEVVADDGRQVELGSPKQRAVLAILALHSNRAVSVDRLLDQLWGDDPPASALGSLHAYISNLRRALEPERPPRAAATVVVSKAPGYLLAVEPDNLDGLLFEQLALSGAELLRDGRAEDAALLLERAVGLWRGPVLADLRDEPFVLPSAERLEELRRSATEDLIDARLLLGQHATVIGELEDLVRDAPLRERAWGQLIVALYRCGRQADALRAYQRARTVLAEELGLDPGPELQRLEQAVLAQDPALDSGQMPRDDPESRAGALTVTPTVPRDESARSAPIGRDEQLARLDSLLSGLGKGDGRVVLVSGEPGVGKTTLLTELAGRARKAGYDVGWGAFQEAGGSLPLEGWSEAVCGFSPGPAPVVDPGTLLTDPQSLTLARLVELVVGPIRDAATRHPVVLVLDDLQWADELSHELLPAVTRLAESTHLLVGLGVRDPVDEPSPKLIETRAALARLPGLERFELTGLDQEGVEALTRRIAEQTPAPEVIRAIYERTAGNPFFVTELTRLLSAQHALDDAEQMARAGVPVGARDVVRRRLARLPEQAVVMLGVASVLGSEVDIRLLHLVTGIDMEELLDLMDLVSVASLVSEVSDRPGVYRFCHDLVREAIYAALPGIRRARLHERSVAGLLELHGEVPAIVHELAWHSVRAVPATGPDPAIPRLHASARLAQMQLSMDYAESQLRLGLTLLADAPSTPERRLLQSEFESSLSQIQFLIRADGDEALACLDRAYEWCANDAERLKVVLQRGLLAALLGDIQAPVDAGDEGRRVARQLNDELSESDSDYCSAFGAWSGDLRTAKRAIDASIALAESFDDPRRRPNRVHVPLPCKRGWRAVLDSLAGDSEAASAGAGVALTAAMKAESTWDLCWTAAFVALGAAIRGDAEEVLRLWPVVAERAAGITYTDSLLRACRAWAEAAGSSHPDPDDLAAARAAQAAAGAGLTAVPLACLEADLRRSVGDLDGADVVLDFARAQAVTMGHRIWLPELERLSANILAARGDVDRARERLTSAIEASSEAGLGLFGCRAARDLDSWRRA